MLVLPYIFRIQAIKCWAVTNPKIPVLCELVVQREVDPKGMTVFSRWFWRGGVFAIIGAYALPGINTVIKAVTYGVSGYNIVIGKGKTPGIHGFMVAINSYRRGYGGYKINRSGSGKFHKFSGLIKVFGPTSKPKKPPPFFVPKLLGCI